MNQKAIVSFALASCAAVAHGAGFGLYEMSARGNAMGGALVGTRHPTLYGTDTAQKFAVGLAHAGWAIYSGLAVGIDAAAHRGARSSSAQCR